MATKKVPFNDSGINQLPDDKPVVYRIDTKGGRSNYVGVAQRGRVHERIGEHLGNIPGATVRVDQFPSIQDAKENEGRVIKRSQPKYNQSGK